MSDAHVTCSVPFSETLKALKHHAENFPSERIAPYEIEQVRVCAELLSARLEQYQWKNARKQMLDAWVSYAHECALDREG